MRNALCFSLLFWFFSCLTSCTGNEQPKTSNVDSLSTSFHPAWSEQATIYEVNLRQYSGAGTFVAFEKSLPRLKDMGVGILWFMPISPIGLIDRKSKPTDLGSYYSVKDYYAVNPEYGTFEQWKELVKMSHDAGFKVILDWVPNHTAPDHPWIKNHPDFYKKDSS
ncbi:MAG TPA: alpha-amylase family glycosyl hydrolase, partial [Puia sp.]|nr:alpha-amylase family glycosyl hydrolase [Puia sp.]